MMKSWIRFEVFDDCAGVLHFDWVKVARDNGDAAADDDNDDQERDDDDDWLHALQVKKYGYSLKDLKRVVPTKLIREFMPTAVLSGTSEEE